MKKHIMLLMAIVCMFAMLTGCVQQDIGVAINADGTGTVSATIGIEEDAYEQLVGMGSDIFEGKETSTYEHDGNPLPTFEGEPRLVAIPDNMDAFTSEIWNALDENNKISLYVRYTDLESGEYTYKILNKNS